MSKVFHIKRRYVGIRLDKKLDNKPLQKVLDSIEYHRKIER